MAQTFGLKANGEALSVGWIKDNDNATALRTGFSGTSAPTDPAPVAGQPWYDTTNKSNNIFTELFGGGAYPLAMNYYQRTWAIAHGDLTEAANGVAQDVTLDELPANCIVLSTRMKTATAFSGGGATAVGVELGWSGDADFYAASYDAFAAAGDTNFQDDLLHTAPTAAAHDIVARFTPDAGNDLLALTAGEIKITVLFAVINTAAYL